MADDPKIDRRDTSYVLTTNLDWSSGYDCAVPKDPQDMVWSTHDRYFLERPYHAEEPWPQIQEAMSRGAAGLAAFFATGADPEFRYVRLKGEAHGGCQRINKLDSGDSAGFYYLDMRDRFELVRFENRGGQWQPIVSDLSSEEAFAYVLSNNYKPFTREQFSIQKVNVMQRPALPQCLKDESFYKLFTVLLSTEESEGFPPEKHRWNGVVAGITDPLQRSHVTQVVAQAIEEARYSGVEVTIDPETADLLRRTINQLLLEHAPRYEQLLGRLRQIRDDIVDNVAEKYAPEPIDTPAPGDLETIIDSLHWCNRCSNDWDDRMARTKALISLKNEMNQWLPSYAYVLQAQAILSSQPQGPIHLTDCAQSRPYRSIEAPADNLWIEGGEVIDLTHVVYEVVLPAIPDLQERAAVRSQFEAALQQAGDLTEAPLGRIEAGAADTIRRIVATALAAQPNNTSLARAARTLRAQPTGPITLMAAGSPFQRGGYLPQIDSVTIDLPTRALARGVELNMASLAKADGRHELARDWKLVLRQWQVEKRFDPVQPEPLRTDRQGSIPFGDRKVPLLAVRGVAGADRVEAWRKILMQGLSFVTEHKDFGNRYLSELARRGVNEIVIVPQAHLDALLSREGADLARQGRERFAKDPEAAIGLLKAAATKFSYHAAGMYLGKTRQILLSAEALTNLQGQKRHGIANIRELFLHELAHADEKVRRDAGILSPKRLAKIDQAQAHSLASDPQTVSNHPEVLSRSPSSTGEWRADGLVTYWTNPKRLREIDPILHHYFVALTRIHQEKEVTGMRNQHPERVTAERWQTPGTPFDPRLGLFAEQAPFNEDWLDCLLQAGNADRWSPQPWERGCRLVND